MTTTKPIKARDLRKGMAIGGRLVTAARRGAGSARYWVYVTYADGMTGRGDRFRVGADLTITTNELGI